MAPTLNDTSRASTGGKVVRCYLMDLPAELRVMIFDLVVLRSRPIHIFHTHDGRLQEPAIAQTCRQLRQEALERYYKSNHFSFLCNCQCKEHREVYALRYYRLLWHAEMIIIDNGSNLNNRLVNDLFKEFRIRHLNSSPYRPEMNGVVEAANKNTKKILAKAVDN